MTHIDNVVKVLQLRIFAEMCIGKDNPDNDKILHYTDAINIINQEYHETYETHPVLLHEDTLAHEFPARKAKS
jgi:hypothetical protein